MTVNRRPHAFKMNMSFAWGDIKRVISAYIIGTKDVDLIREEKKLRRVEHGHRERCSWGKRGIYFRSEVKGIIFEILNGIFRRGK